MTKHNQEILECLQDYLKIKKPGYAVLLKGSWGCGKTFFIKNWIGSLKTEKNDNELYYTLNPIYISLYGMTATSQIDEELKRAVSPILHSKAMKVASKVFKIAISAALRYNIDLDKNGEADLKMDCTIDPKALLGSNDPHVKGNRLLVFDDIERSNMDAIDVLGYINYYVEHIGCNVVIVGDDVKLKDKNEFNAKKEKTIGREFELDPDVDAAVDNFVQDENMLDKYRAQNETYMRERGRKRRESQCLSGFREIERGRAKKTKRLHCFNSALHGRGILRTWTRGKFTWCYEGFA